MTWGRKEGGTGISLKLSWLNLLALATRLGCLLVCSTQSHTLQRNSTLPRQRPGRRLCAAGARCASPAKDIMLWALHCNSVLELFRAVKLATPKRAHFVILNCTRSDKGLWLGCVAYRPGPFNWEAVGVGIWLQVRLKRERPLDWCCVPWGGLKTHVCWAVTCSSSSSGASCCCCCTLSSMHFA